MNEKNPKIKNSDILKVLKEQADPIYAAHHQKFFQTHQGGYGEGDLFWGLKVPQLRKIAKQFKDSISLVEMEKLLQSPIHEARFVALVILTDHFKRAGKELKDEIVRIFAGNLRYINNWDLVDCFSPHILGPYYYGKAPYKKLWQLAKSKNLWQERIALLSTLYFIRQREFGLTVALAEFFLQHPHDLMHKAVGWMLREVGKREKKGADQVS